MFLFRPITKQLSLGPHARMGQNRQRVRWGRGRGCDKGGMVWLIYNKGDIEARGAVLGKWDGKEDAVTNDIFSY